MEEGKGEEVFHCHEDAKWWSDVINGIQNSETSLLQP
jgi:hypothetical protein